MRIKLAAALALVVAMCVAVWLASSEHGGRTRDLLRRALGPPAQVIEGIPRRQLDCPRGNHSRRLVALTFGQSNAANYVRGRHKSKEGVINYFRGRCYAGQDPLPGATGTGGSVWSRLGDLLIVGGDYDEVVLVGVAVSATSVARWSVGGDLHPRLLDVLADMQSHGLAPTHLLWHQGETDAKEGTAAETYRHRFLAMLDALRARGFEAPVYVATASYCHGRSSAAVREAQAALVNPGAGIHAGPDTDVLKGPGWRHDECHFSEQGAVRHAELWRDALMASRTRQ